MNQYKSNRFATLLFIVIGLLFILYGIYKFLLPSLEPDHWNWLSKDKEVIQYISGNFRWSGLCFIGLGAFTVLITSTAFRRGEKWAWWALWYLPVMFLIGAFVVWAWHLLLLLCILAVVALLISKKQFIN